MLTSGVMDGFGFRLLIALASAGALSTAGCARTSAEAAFAADFDCQETVVEDTESSDRYRVSGCGRQAVYLCSSYRRGECVVQTTREDAPAPPERASTEQRSRPSKKSESSGLELELQLEPKALLKITAAPKGLQLQLIRYESSTEADACGLDWMLNGQRMSMPKAVTTRKASLLALSVHVGKELVAELSTAKMIALRSCKTRWLLSGDQVLQVRELMQRFQEEAAWNQEPRDGSTGGMMAPTGGWPAWSAGASPLPSAASGPSLDPRELFRKLSPSVFQVEVKRSDGTAQGSAVAISAGELLTNCHVVQGGLELTLKQGKQQWPARVVRADPKTDRCTLSAEGAKLQPVAGVRSYESLEVGEPAYTLGSPVGLELTLSSGLVSGRREEAGNDYVQTTAPISPGSSGGGLFDARGNLIGVTTLVLVGREHLNQSLNFAIAADAFWKP